MRGLQGYPGDNRTVLPPDQTTTSYPGVAGQLQYQVSYSVTPGTLFSAHAATTVRLLRTHIAGCRTTVAAMTYNHHVSNCICRLDLGVGGPSAWCGDNPRHGGSGLRASTGGSLRASSLLVRFEQGPER